LSKIGGIGKVSQVQIFFMKRYFKRPSLIEEGDMITVTNIYFYDIEDSGKE
jgi:hypothetical protein